MKCPECVRLGERSKLYMPTGYFSTDMGGTQIFYDEDGKYHHHEVNHRIGEGKCSNGHSLDVVASTKCPAPDCEYGEPQKITFVPPPPPQPEPKCVTLNNLTIEFGEPPKPESGVIIIHEQ